jgi:hypothetical protein
MKIKKHTFKYTNYYHISEEYSIKMGDIKIVVSEKLDKLVEAESEKIGIKKTEFVKSLLIEYFREEKKK